MQESAGKQLTRYLRSVRKLSPKLREFPKYLLFSGARDLLAREIGFVMPRHVR
jgi:hypothetical protein